MVKEGCNYYSLDHRKTIRYLSVTRIIHGMNQNYKVNKIRESILSANELESSVGQGNSMFFPTSISAKELWILLTTTEIYLHILQYNLNMKWTCAKD